MKLHNALLSSVLLVIGSCCDDPELQLSDMNARIDFAATVSLAVEFDLNMALEFGGDFAGWSGVSAASSANLAASIGGDAYQQTVQLDIDDDGVEEAVRWVAFSDVGPEAPQQLLAAWEGDKYSFDAGRCYLLAQQGAEVRLLSAQCQQPQPALVCVRAGDAESALCQVCDEQGTCAACKSDSVLGCVEEGARELAKAPDLGGGGAGGDAGGGGAPGGGSTGSISVEFDSCVEQTKLIASAAKSCAHAPPRQAAVLCEQELSAVNICFAAVGAADLFGSPCAALDSKACSTVFP